MIDVLSAGTRSVLLTIHAGMNVFGYELRPNDLLVGATSATALFAAAVGIGWVFVPRNDGGDSEDFGEAFDEVFDESLVEVFDEALVVALDGDRPEDERLGFTHSLFRLVFAKFKFVRDFSPFFEVLSFCEKIPSRDCNIIFLDLIGPRHITAGLVGM